MTCKKAVKSHPFINEETASQSSCVLSKIIQQLLVEFILVFWFHSPNFFPKMFTDQLLVFDANRILKVV